MCAETEKMRPKNCWVISEGHAGMENQAIGLAEAIGVDFDVKRLKPGPPWTWLPSGWWPQPMRALKPDSDDFTTPWPDMMISSGRRSVPYSLYAGGASQGRIFRIHIQNPQCRLSRFNLVAVPEHDRLAGDNIISTLGALHRVTPQRLADEGHAPHALLTGLSRPLIAVLIGGSSSAYKMTPAVATMLAGQLSGLAQQGHGLAMTPSRRTGAENIAILQRETAGTGIRIWNFEGENPYFKMLAQADVILVTADSVSMLSEAVATGKPVYVIALQGGSRKLEAFHTALYERGLARPFEGAVSQFETSALVETARVAGEIERRYDLWAR